ncbi:MAG: hypothetical protein JW723_11935 [Bacteroidales bacterium]|nr:hypothetical protein [Bacteroidales bacterium]
MNKILIHILEFNICLSIMYLIYRILIHNEAIHQLNRFTLITIPVIALAVTLVKIDLSTDLSAYYAKITFLQNDSERAAAADPGQMYQHSGLRQNGKDEAVIETSSFPQVPLLPLLFAVVGIILLFRLFIQNLKLIRMIKTSEVCQYGKLRLVKLNHKISPFSYFRYVFLNQEQLNPDDLYYILLHEHVHFIQKHSWDNLYIELVGLFQWFNPFYWLLRSSLKETHEYLADEGAVKLGINSTDYQVLLLNQVAEGPLMPITCNFSKSLIKKRIIMMQKLRKSVLRSITKLFFMLPVIVLLALIFSCNTQTRQKEKHVAAVSPTKMNVLYLGADNPVAIAVSGISAEEIIVKIDNGEIEGELGKYVVRPSKAGAARIKVYKVKKDKKELLQETEFRVKTIPDPKAYVAGKKGGKITREELLEANEVQVYMENFDFDLTFKVIEFVLSAAVPGTYTIREEISKSNAFSEAQIDLIKSLAKNQKVYFEDIVCIGPDGTKRKLGTVGFEITE